MILISGFESQAANLNNYQLVTNSCKLAIFCSFLLSKLGNKIVNSPKQLRKSISITQCPWSDHEIRVWSILFCNLWSVVTNCSQWWQFFIDFEACFLLYHYFCSSWKCKKTGSLLRGRIGYVSFPPSSVCLKSFRYYTRPNDITLNSSPFFVVNCLSIVCSTFWKVNAEVWVCAF